MTDQERLNEISSKLDKLFTAVNKNHAANMKAHGVIEGQNLDKRVSSIEKKFWPIVGAATIVAPLLTGAVLAYMGG